MIILQLIFLIALILLPIKWAADFADGANTGLIACLFSSIVAVVVSVIAFRIVSGGFIGFLAASFTMLASYAFILKIPAHRIIGFAVISLALFGAIIFAFISFGISATKIAS